MMKETLIKVHTRFEAFHAWPKAPEEVSFLRNKHRHIYHVYVLLRVTHADRDLEFFLVQWALRGFIENEIIGETDDLGSKSCEMLAEEIGKFLQRKYGKDSVHSVEVYEDGENGAIVQWFGPQYF